MMNPLFSILTTKNVTILFIDHNDKKNKAGVRKDNGNDANGKRTHRPQRSLSFFVSLSHFLLHDLPKKKNRNTRRKTKKKRERLHAECKERSLVVNLTHEIAGTDVADKRILFRLNYFIVIFYFNEKRFLIVRIVQ
jgi:hypothetical protein